MKVIVNQLRDPLHETTRKVRRNLLASSIVGLTIVKVGLVPEKITAFGVEFTESNQEALLLLLAGVVSYFLISFLVYLTTEYSAWKLALKSEELDQFKAREDTDRYNFVTNKSSEHYIEHANELMNYGKVSLVFRVVIEVLIPIGVGIWAIVSLL